MLEAPPPRITSFDDFVEASSLGPHNVAEFRARIADREDVEAVLDPLVPPGRPQPLPAVRDSLHRLMGRRRSVREFSDAPLSVKQLARILAATGSSGARRVLPSAGGLNPIHVYGVARSVDVKQLGVFKYQQDDHTVTAIAGLPDDNDLREMFQLQTESMPQLLIVFAAEPRPTIDKYGERGGRFLLQEVGHAAHSISLRLAKDRLRGYALGGLLDEPIRRLLGIQQTAGRVLGGFACGR